MPFGLRTEDVRSVGSEERVRSTLCPNKNVTTLSHHNSNIQESVLIIFGTNVTEKVGNPKMFCFPISPN